MKIGRSIPCRIDALYGSEVKFGYDKPIANQHYQYRVEGVLIPVQQIVEAIPELPKKLILRRLSQGHFDNTWADLRRPVKAITDRGREGMRQGGRNWVRAQRAIVTKANDRSAYYKRLREGHKPL